MALNKINIAGNLRRLAGMHLVPLEVLAFEVGISRQAMQSIVSIDPASRSYPRADTAIKLAEAFGVSLDALYEEPLKCLREAVERFPQAPIALFVEERTAGRLELKQGESFDLPRPKPPRARRARKT